MNDKRKQEPIGLNSMEKNQVLKAIKILNSFAEKGDKKITLSSFIREASVERAKFVINLNK